MKGKELVKKLEKNGWILDRIKGSHHVMKKDGKTVVVPVHNTDVQKGLLKAILKDMGLE